MQRSGSLAAVLPTVACLAVLGSVAGHPVPPATTPGCVVRPELPHLLAFAHPTERRRVPLATSCLLAGPVSLDVFAGRTRVASVVWLGGSTHEVRDGALGTLTLRQDRTPSRRYTVSGQVVPAAGRTGATVRTVPVGFGVKDACRATLTIRRIHGHLVAYGITEQFDGAWNKQELIGRLEVRRHRDWVLYRRFDSDAELSQGYYGDYRVRLPDTVRAYRVEIGATGTRALFVSRSHLS